MKISRVWAWILVLVGIGAFTSVASARHAAHPQQLSKARSSQASASHHAASRSSRAASKKKANSSAKAGAAVSSKNARADRSSRSARTSVRAHARRVSVSRRSRFVERFTASSYATTNIFAADQSAGEDPVVRSAAIDAMGDMNGTAVVIDASSGRILAMVNQKLALSSGAEPCSTIKLSVAMAALSEGLVTRDTPVKLGGFQMNMTQALAHSNNLYFEALGRQLGFERVHHYAKEFGLGELAGYRIPGEQLGVYPDHPIPAAEGGVGRMCSFGQGVELTPLQLGAFVAAIANGGTLYYLQHPTTPEQIADFEPKVKRTLDIARYIPEIEEGMAGAVEFGTARRLRSNFQELPVFGKTGTCSEHGTRLGWFAAYADTPQGKLATVFFLEGGRPTFGPRAAELTGVFYKNLWERNYFTRSQPNVSTSAQLSSGAAQ